MNLLILLLLLFSLLLLLTLLSSYLLLSYLSYSFPTSLLFRVLCSPFQFLHLHLLHALLSFCHDHHCLPLSLIFTYSHAVIEGDMGLLIWDMLCLAALTGLLSFLDLTLLHLLVELCVVVLWLAVHVQLRRKVCVCVCVCVCVSVASQVQFYRIRNNHR
jgi:hypothetical protein